MIREAFAVEETIALAKRKACEILGENEEKVQFEIIQSPEKKKFGLFGGKMAQVRAFVRESKGEIAKKYVEEILFYMGSENVTVEISEEDEEFCTLKITGGDIKYVVGRHGSTLDAIQYLAGFAANQNRRDKYCKIRLEAGEYREKRKKSLMAFARRMAYDVVKRGQKLELEPMRSYERKLIHSAIQRIEGVDSWSEGENEMRHVVISPQNFETSSKKLSNELIDSYELESLKDSDISFEKSSENVIETTI